MAISDLEIKVSVEKTIHLALQKALQKIWDDHQLCVQSISCDWADTSTYEKYNVLLTGLDINTSTKL